MYGGNHVVAVVNRDVLKHLLEQCFNTIVTGMTKCSTEATIQHILIGLNAAYSMRFFLNHFDSLVVRLSKKLDMAHCQTISEYARHCLQFYRTNKLDPSLSLSVQLTYDMLNQVVMGELALLYLATSVKMNGHMPFEYPNVFQMTKLQSLLNEAHLQKHNLSVIVTDDGLLTGIRYRTQVEGLSYAVVPLPFYDSKFLETLELRGLEPYHLGELFIEVQPKDLTAVPVASIVPELDIVYSGGLLSAIFAAFPPAEIALLVDAIQQYLAGFLEKTELQYAEEKSRAYAALIQKIPRPDTPMSTWDPKSHRLQLTKHVLMFTKHDLKEISRHIGSSDPHFTESFMVLNRSTRAGDVDGSVFDWHSFNDLPLSVLERPLVRVGAKYYTSSLLLLHAYMYFIQRAAMKSSAYRLRKGIAFEAYLSKAVTGVRVTKVILLSPEDHFPANSQKHLNRIRNLSSEWGIPIEEIVVLSLDRPYMEFDLAIEDGTNPPLFIEAKANSFLISEYVLGRTTIRSRMLQAHKALRSKILEAHKHQEFRNRFGETIEGLVVSQDSFLSVGYLDIKGATPATAYQNLRRMVNQLGVTPEGYGSAISAVFTAEELGNPAQSGSHDELKGG